MNWVDETLFTCDLAKGETKKGGKIFKEQLGVKSNMRTQNFVQVGLAAANSGTGYSRRCMRYISLLIKILSI